MRIFLIVGFVVFVVAWLVCVVLPQPEPLQQPPTPSPFVVLIDTPEDFTAVRKSLVGAVFVSPDRKFRYGEQWYSSRHPDGEPDEIQTKWKLTVGGCGAVCIFSDRADALAAAYKLAF